ncbi:MAG: STAS domain-containing protein [Bacteroidia bacterium]
MKFEFEKRGPIKGVFRLEGSMIGETDGMPLAEAFNEQMEDGFLHFILDLSDLKHINSSGLGVFITLLTKARKKDGDVVIVNPSANIRSLLLITKLNSIFHIYDSVEAALE